MTVPSAAPRPLPAHCRPPADADRLMARAAYEIAGRTAFITGAARGIGAETARRLHARGANVALVGLEPDRLEALAAELGERAAPFEADVTDAAALESAVEGSRSRFGGIDIAIANAGISYVGTLASSPVEQVERTLEVNLMGVWRTDRAVVGEIVERRGYLLNVASLSAVSHAPLMGAYTASKAGVEAMTDALRLELAPSGARVGCAYFGFIDTDLVRGGFSHPAADRVNTLLPRFVRRSVHVSKAVDAIERGILRRSARLWAPRYVGPSLLLRGLVQPLTERRIRRSPRLAEAIELADSHAGDAIEQDSLLGVAAEAIDQPRLIAPAP